MVNRSSVAVLDGKTGKRNIALIELCKPEINGSHVPFPIPKPNLYTLYFHAGHSNYEVSRKKWFTEIKPNLTVEVDDTIRLVTNLGDQIAILNVPNSTDVVYDLIESLFAAIVFSYAGVEAFSNSLLPDDYFDEKNKDKDAIERNSKLNTKLNVVLPKIYGIKPPQDCDFWTDFKALEEMRHEIVHTKSGFGFRQDSQRELIQSVFDSLMYTEIHTVFKKVIDHLLSELKKSSAFKNHHKLSVEFGLGDSQIEDIVTILYPKS